MQLTNRTVAATLATAARQVTHPSQDWGGWCLAFVRTAWGIAPTGLKSANEAWEESEQKHRRGTPHAGAPVYWEVGKFGHVALSVGDGTVYSNDIRRQGKIDRVPISEITQRWGARYRGWTTDYAGRSSLPLAPRAKPVKIGGTVSLKAVRKAAKADPDRPDGENTPGSVGDVRIVEKALRREGLLDRPHTDGHFGTSTVAAYRMWQLGLGFDGKDANGIPGEQSLSKLGNRYGFKVVD